MKILQVTNQMNNIKRFGNQKSSTSFKGIYVEDIVDLGKASEQGKDAKFLQSDALLLNRIAQEYPNQDCFIRKGYARHPYLEFREKPTNVQLFSTKLNNRYSLEVKPDDDTYPCETLILYPDSKINKFIGLPSFISTNPSLPYTIKIGFELHKLLIKKKEEIKKAFGQNDDINIGKTLIKSAHKEIEEEETAVTRYLMECAYNALTDRASAQQIYSSNYPKIQTRLDAERMLDLTTSVSDKPQVSTKDILSNKKNIINEILQEYPDYDENKKRITELENYMSRKGISL